MIPDSELCCDAFSHRVSSHDSRDGDNAAGSDRTLSGLCSAGGDSAQYLGDCEGMVTRDSACTEPASDSAVVLDEVRGFQLTPQLAIADRDRLMSGDDLCCSQLEPDHTSTQVSSRIGGTRRCISLSTTNQMIASPNQDNDDQTRRHRRKRGAGKKQTQ
eukprot:1475792-Rhodomonas_salina.2